VLTFYGHGAVASVAKKSGKSSIPFCLLKNVSIVGSLIWEMSSSLRCCFSTKGRKAVVPESGASQKWRPVIDPHACVHD